MRTNIKVPHSLWDVECYNPDGTLAWSDKFRNQVTDEGVNFLLSQFFTGGGYTAEWYAGLLDDDAGLVLSTGDTAAEHAGWTENTNYDAAGRPAVTFGSVASKTISNVNSRTSFTITGVGGTIAGTFITNNSTKNGTAGILYATALFSSGPKVLSEGAVILVTITFLGEEGA